MKDMDHGTKNGKGKNGFGSNIGAGMHAARRRLQVVDLSGAVMRGKAICAMVRSMVFVRPPPVACQPLVMHRHQIVDGIALEMIKHLTGPFRQKEECRPEVVSTCTSAQNLELMHRKNE